MNQFVVPQFLDIEDKIFGPITVRQFLILLASGLIHFVVFKLVDTALFILFFAFFGGFTLILAFVKINGQAFHYFLLNIFQTIRRPSLRIWNKALTKEELNQLRHPIKNVVQEHFEVKHASVNRIRDLSLLVNTGGYYKPE
jgi:hypothetical protein